jgi:pimeloyl-ACP methyl ester carboxylesterase
MPEFRSGAFTLNFETWRDLETHPVVMLVHGFASSLTVNWVNPLWVKTLTDAGYAVVAFDHRGHGKSTSSLNPPDYAPDEMAGDAFRLLDHLGLKQAHFMGYSMGARVSAFAALAAPERVQSLCFGGLGMALIEGAGFWGPVHDALLADDISEITDQRALMFRKFADQTKSDRIALASCIEGSRVNLRVIEAQSITAQTLIAVGTKDDLAGDPHQLAGLMQHAEAFDIVDRDHMLAVGDKSFKERYLAFLRANN